MSARIWSSEWFSTTNTRTLLTTGGRGLCGVSGLVDGAGVVVLFVLVLWGDADGLAVASVVVGAGGAVVSDSAPDPHPATIRRPAHSTAGAKRICYLPCPLEHPAGFASCGCGDRTAAHHPTRGAVASRRLSALFLTAAVDAVNRA